MCPGDLVAQLDHFSTHGNTPQMLELDLGFHHLKVVFHLQTSTASADNSTLM